VVEKARGLWKKRRDQRAGNLLPKSKRPGREIKKKKKATLFGLWEKKKKNGGKGGRGGGKSWRIRASGKGGVGRDSRSLRNGERIHDRAKPNY